MVVWKVLNYLATFDLFLNRHGWNVFGVAMICVQTSFVPESVYSRTGELGNWFRVRLMSLAFVIAWSAQVYLIDAPGFILSSLLIDDPPRFGLAWGYDLYLWGLFEGGIWIPARYLMLIMPVLFVLITRCLEPDTLKLKWYPILITVASQIAITSYFCLMHIPAHRLADINMRTWLWLWFYVPQYLLMTITVFECWGVKLSHFPYIFRRVAR